MTAKVSDERLAMWIAQAPRDSNGELAHEAAMMAVELQEKRVLVRECEQYLQHKDDSSRCARKMNGPCVCGLDALLARVRGEI